MAATFMYYKLTGSNNGWRQLDRKIAEMGVSNTKLMVETKKGKEWCFSSLYVFKLLFLFMTPAYA